MGMLDNLTSFDAFSRTDSEYRIRTKSGAITIALMVLLFITELSIFLSSDIKPELYVDTSLGEHIQINLDVDFHALPCPLISVNAMDKTGNHHLNVHDNIYLERLDAHGRVISDAPEREVVGSDKHQPDITIDVAPSGKPGCGNCYGAETPDRPCCNTCEEVQEAYRAKGWAFTNPGGIEQCVKEGFLENIAKQKGEGCRVRGFLWVNRVAGNVNIVPGKFIMQNARYVLDTKMFESGGALLGYWLREASIDFLRFLHLSFGVDYPGMKNPLDGVSKFWQKSNESPMYEYFVKVVPTTYADRYGTVISTNQFSVTEYTQSLPLFGARGGVPGLFVMYDLSPIIVDYKESSRSFLHFVTNLCAIIGGVFTVASLVDSFVYSGLRTLKKKLELGKQG